MGTPPRGPPCVEVRQKVTNTEIDTALSQLILELYDIIQAERSAAEDALDACALAEAQLDEVARTVLPEGRPAPCAAVPAPVGAVYADYCEVAHG